MIAPYRRLLAHLGVPQLVIIDLFVKLGTPVLSLALLLAAVSRLGSYAVGGLVLAAHALALALCAPPGGRLADRLGARRTLLGYLAVHTTAYALLLLALALKASPPVLIGAAALLGVTNPPTGAVIRGAWPRLVPAESLTAAYAIDSAINELMFILGPALVTVLLLAISAQTVVLVAGTAVLLGVAMLITSQAIRHAPPERASSEITGSRIARLAGPLNHRPTLTLLILAAFGTFSYGCLRIATVAATTTFGSATSAGLLMALLSAGALAGALGFGARTWSLSGRLLVTAFCLVDAAAMLADAFAHDFLSLAVLITVTAVLTGPRDTLVPALLAEQAPERYRTEVFAWLNTFMWTGYGLGTAIAGSVTGPTDSGSAAFTTAAAVALLGATLAFALYRPAQRLSRNTPLEEVG